MKLNKRWKELKNNASTENVLMTVSEIVKFYERGRININPSYQREYRWSNEQKTKFIESLLLRYPIPPIISIKTENKNGLYEYEIIDGVQRLSTIFEFVGAKPNNGQLLSNSNEQLKLLEGANTFLEINGKSWGDFVTEEFDFIFESSALLFTNLTTNDEDIKYEMFERLNSLATELSTQEIRNSIIALKDPDSFNYIADSIYNLSKTFISDKDIVKRNDLELFVEFSLIKRHDYYIDKINEKINFLKTMNSQNKARHFDIFLSSYIRIVNIDELKEDIIDYREFLKLNENLYFKRYNTEKGKTSGNIVKFFFEILGFLYFKNPSLINEDFYKKNFSETYANIMKNKLGKNNPNAKVRFDIAKDIVKEFKDGNTLF